MRYGFRASTRASGVEGVATGEFDVGWIGVLTNAPWIVTNHGAALVDFLWEDPVLGMQKFGVTAWIDAVDLEVLDPGLELGAELRSQSEALLLSGEVHQART